LNEIRLRAPATIANFGPGFDIFALALKAPHDLITIQRSSTDTIRIKIIGGNEELPTDPQKNTAGVATMYFMEKFKLSVGVDIEIKKGMPSGAGLGTSAASSLASVYGLNKLFETDLSITEIIEIAGRGETASGGTVHFDNVAGCCLGGFVLIRNTCPLQIERIEVPQIPIVIRVQKKPQVTSRGRIPKEFTLAQVKEQMAWCAWLIQALRDGDLRKIGEAVNRDHISEPVRSCLIPDYANLKKNVLAAGAFGCNVSGGGSSIFAVCEKDKLNQVAAIMKTDADSSDDPPLVLKTEAGNVGLRQIDEL
jgi:homoserine kinase